MRRPLTTDRAAVVVERLAALTGRSARLRLLRRAPELHAVAGVELLADEATRRVRIQLDQAERLAGAACVVADRLGDAYARARALRASGHVLAVRGAYADALAQYEEAARLFRRTGRASERAITLSGALQTLIYLGRYDDAFRWAGDARAVFVAQNDRLRLARLDTNLANILHRQDRFAEALALYRRALAALRRLGDPQDVAIALRNLAVCQISLNRFREALRTYRTARSWCTRHGLRRLVAEADYNIAYLHYLRGEYTRAIDLYEHARLVSRRLGDSYHRALCDLDLAELHLELNLSSASERLARAALAGFRRLGMRYEAAKALAYLGIAVGLRGRTPQALRLFQRARGLFVEEKNLVWPALLDLYKALILLRTGRLQSATRFCRSALRFFSGTALANRTGLCEILLARLCLQQGRLAEARRLAAGALTRLERAEAPSLMHQAWYVSGRVAEAMGDRATARRAYETAHRLFEALRSHLQADELKVVFLRDKLEVYEGLVWLSLTARRPDPEAAFAYIEQAKARSLTDELAFRAHVLCGHGIETRILERVRHLRGELAWHARRIGLEALQADSGAAARITGLRRRTRRCESELLRSLAHLAPGDAAFTTLQAAGWVGLEAIRNAVPAGGCLLEYYEVRGVLHACVLSRNTLAIVPVATTAHVRRLLQLLQFQLSKFRLGEAYVAKFASRHRAAIEAHLGELHRELVEPVGSLLAGVEHLIVVPHKALHSLPFHALHDGEQYLVDRAPISYAPSASVYALCSREPAAEARASLVLGVPDRFAPGILDEAREVAAALPRAELVLGAEATADRLRSLAPGRRFVHVATHGMFRQDNPMFSAIRLAGSSLRLQDLYDLELSAELVSLSGCGTGLGVAVGGDEILGMTRGLLYAGARAVLVTLWDVHDQSTAEFMAAFYRGLRRGKDKAAAMRDSMIALREHYPHPYFWAPFVLVGQTAPPAAISTVPSEDPPLSE